MPAVLVVFVALGLAVGSFLNLCIDRIPQGLSILWPRSRCDGCGRQVGAFDLVPVLSYLWLRGRCRWCGAMIPLRVLWVELLTGFMFGLLLVWLGPGTKALVAMVYSALLLTVAVIDLEQRRIPNVILFPLLLVGPLLALGFGLSLGSSLAGGALGFVLLALPYVLSRGGMGGGDVKLAALIGELLGYPAVLVALFAAVLLGSVVGVALLAARWGKRDHAVPFAPFLAAGAAVTMLFGDAIVTWYTGFF